MAVADSFEKLIREALDDHGVHAFFFAEVVHVFLEIVLEILKDEDKFFIGVDNLTQRDDVDVVELLQDRDLADGGRGNALLLRLQPNFLEGEDFPGLFVCISMGLP